MPKPFNSWARSMKEDIARRLRENEEVRGYNGSTVLRERGRERERCVPHRVADRSGESRSSRLQTRRRLNHNESPTTK